MEIKTIKSHIDNEKALQEIERLWDAAPGTPEAERLELLVTLVEAYEEEHFSLPLPDPMEWILYYKESRGLQNQP